MRSRWVFCAASWLFSEASNTELQDEYTITNNSDTMATVVITSSRVKPALCGEGLMGRLRL
jgi:hypothetical protein